MKRGRRVKQKRMSCVQGGRGLTHQSTCEKGPFLHVFCNIFICRVFYHTLLSLTTIFITVLLTVAIIIFLSLKCFTVFFSKNIPFRNGKVIWVRVRTQKGGRSKRTCACDGGRGGQTFAILVRTY